MARLASSSTVSIDWLLPWGLPVPPKIKIFVWHLCHNGLATRENLLRRGIGHDASCTKCHRSMEDDTHLFLQCDYVKAAWNATKFATYGYLSQATSWLHIFRLLKEHSANDWDVLAKYAMCLWGIWTDQNRFVFTGKSSLPYEMINRMMEYFTVY